MWQRIAAFFSFLALVSALLAPSAMLAEEVRTGKLGGLCSAASSSSGEQGDTDTVLPHTPCDACGSPAVLFHRLKPTFAEAAEQGTPNAGSQHEVFGRYGKPACIRGPPTD